jgi:hypothetical protein
MGNDLNDSRTDLFLVPAIGRPDGLRDGDF